MKYGQDTVDQIRSIMDRGNPVPPNAPAASWHGTHARETHDWITALTGAEAADPQAPSAPTSPRWPRGPMPANGHARRVIAPVTAALAVAGVIAGVTLAANSGNSARNRPPAGASAASLKVRSATDSTLPAFYVTLSLQGPTGVAIAEVHSSLTGRVLSQVQVGYFFNNINVSADGSDRAFVVEAAATNNIKSDKDGLYLLRVSANGTSIKVTRLPITILPANSPDVVDGIAVSPDGTKVAVALQINKKDPNVRPHGEVVLYSMNSYAVTRKWTAPSEVGLPWDPAWTGGNQQLNFVWQYQIKGGSNFYTGSSQVRTLNTALAGSNLLSSSTALVSGGGKVGFIQAAYAGPAGAPIIAATFHVTSVGGSGTATVQLVELSTTGSILKVIADHTYSYSNAKQEGADVAGCQVDGVDASAQDTLAYCTHFGTLTDDTFTPLPHNPIGADAAW